jgi:hypothetical protein
MKLSVHYSAPTTRLVGQRRQNVNPHRVTGRSEGIERLTLRQTLIVDFGIVVGRYALALGEIFVPS